MSEATELRPASTGGATCVLLVVAIGVSWILMAAFWAPAGVFNVDGVIYRAMIDAIVRNGSLFVENGYEFCHSSDLKL